ncbi:hypothetical protein HYT23_01290 [Candidatus Pacearchaeota archaeon]|nr:hypothetical protein [Candidatus Pacearchaeota archaeon]
MRESRKTNFEKKFLLAEAILVFGALIYLFFAMAPNAISPVSGQTIFEPDFVFEIENGQEILISSTIDFANPIVLKEGSELDLLPGTYYWKVKNWLMESEIKTFTIQSNVALNLVEGEEKNILENAGNVDVNVAEKKGGITTNIELEQGKSVEVGKGDVDYEGRQNE